jgi:hypothetical protein
LILGGSRACKGLNPQVFEKELKLKKNSVLNFAFNGTTSPYGEKYLNLIKRKIKKTKEDQFFILSTNPLNIMDFSDSNINREDEFVFYDLWMVNSSPNIEYILRSPKGRKPVIQKLLASYAQPDFKKKTKIHSNGWEEMVLINKNHAIEKGNRKNLIKYNLKKSESREQWFIKTIKYLSKIGTVYLVRLPISLPMNIEEEKLSPGFDKWMEQISAQPNVHYLNFKDNTENFELKDPHHLSGKGALEFSLKLAHTIKTMN